MNADQISFGGITIKSDAKGLAHVNNVLQDVQKDIREQNQQDERTNLILAGLTFQPSDRRPQPPLRVRVALVCWERETDTRIHEFGNFEQDSDDAMPSMDTMLDKMSPDKERKFLTSSERNQMFRHIQKKIRAHYDGGE